MASLIGTRIKERDEMTDAGIPLQILSIGRERWHFTLGYNPQVCGGVRNRSYSPCLSFPEALYLLQNARNSGILTLEPSESLLCYVESLRSSNHARSKPSAEKTSKKQNAPFAKRFSPEKLGKAEKFSTASESSDSL